MEYTVISIQANNIEQLKAIDKAVSGNEAAFDYGGIVPEPEWLKWVPDEPVTLYDEKIPEEEEVIHQVTLTVRQTSTFRAWFLEALTTLNQRDLVPREFYARNIDLTHSIFDRRNSDILEELKFQLSIRPNKSIRDIYGDVIGQVIECWLCHRLLVATGANCKNKWKEVYIGTSIQGVLIEKETNYAGDNPHIAYSIQTVGGTPWALFRSMSSVYPDARITVSDIDLNRSIIQIKLYRKGKIVTTMTTEDTTIFKQLDLHLRDIFNGVYFYIPTHHVY